MIMGKIKKQIRKMRPVARDNGDGTRSTHMMAWEGDPSKRRGNFKVYPTIAPKPGKQNSSKASDWTEQDEAQAKARGEVIQVKRRKKAEKLAAGSWKKGKDKREAMKDYRKSKRKG